jgi:integrase/recombinase XerD
MKTMIKIIPEEKNLLMKYLVDYLEWMKIHNFSKKTLENRKSYVKKFIRYCESRGIEEPQDVTKDFLSRYQRHIYHESSEKTGEPLSTAEKHYRISHVISFFSYLVKMNHILYNPGADIELPKTPRSLPSNVLTEDEAKAILNQADINTPSGVRDRAILETFYSTGIRRKELSYVRLCDIDFEERSLMIRAGKCQKDRLIPIGERALDWITRYITSVRPLFLKDTKSEYVFLTPWGTRFGENALGMMVKGYVEKAGIKKSGSSILFRHTMATLMLENGADIRYIQQMLGHKRLETTQIYTHISIGKLKEVHDKTHPAKLKTKSTKEPA